MELFESAIENKNMPLAYRMRPRNLDEYIGQDHIIGPGRLLRRAIQADRLSSVIFYGPPGTGKTTLARVIANTTKSHFTTLNAVLSGVKELRDEIEEAKKRLSLYGRRTILFVDEVHRWNKSQQDALLPHVENGTFILIGATTENPFFEVNAALVSRSRIFQLKSLTNEDLKAIAVQALEDKERGYGNLNIKFEENALEHLVDVASGDARSLLNALELAVTTTQPGKDGVIFISKEAAEESIQKKVVLYDRDGDYHYDIISAFIKSLRGSDPDAALYWLAKMVHAGEDPRFIFRRMLISACEDVGMADPNAIRIVTSDAQAFDMVGMPEGRYHLTHAALYLSTCPKSNSALGFFDALKTVEQESQDAEVPNHLKDNSRDSKGFGHGEGYMYPHSYREHWVAQQYLPNVLQGKIFYNPTEIGYEKTIRDEVNKKREIQLESVNINAFEENLTFSPEDKERDMWIRRTSVERSRALINARDRIFSSLSIKRNDRILVLNAGHGMLIWEAFRHTPEGLVAAIVTQEEDKSFIQHRIGTLPPEQAPLLFTNLEEIEESLKFEHIIGRNILTSNATRETVLKQMKAKLAPKGKIAFTQVIPSLSERLSGLIHMGPLQNRLLKAEEKIYRNNPAVFTEEELIKQVEKYFKIEDSSRESFTEERIISETNLRKWITESYAPAMNENAEDLLKELIPVLCNKPVNWTTTSLFLKLLA